MGDLLVVRRDGEIVADLLDKNFRRHILFHHREESASRPRLKPSNGGERLLHFINRPSGTAGDFGNAPFAQRFHIIADDAVFEGFFLAGPLKLEHQAFA